MGVKIERKKTTDACIGENRIIFFSLFLLSKKYVFAREICVSV